MNRQKHNQIVPPCPGGPIPKTDTLLERMRRKLQTMRGRKIYARRVMRIAVGADHAGVPLNDTAIAELRRLGHEVVDQGTHDPTQPDDYPDYAAAVAEEVTSGRCERGLLICGSGVNIAMGNASADVQRQAQFVTSSNEDEGFAKAMETFILGGHQEFVGAAS